MSVLLFNSRVELFPRKLRSRWSGFYEVVKIFPYRIMELKHPKTQETFKVNGQRVKQYFEDHDNTEKRNVETLSFKDP